MLRNPSDLAKGFKVNCYFGQAEQSVVNDFGLPPDATSPFQTKIFFGVCFWGGCGWYSPRLGRGVRHRVWGGGPLPFPQIRAAPAGLARIRCFSGAIPGANPARNPSNLTLNPWTYVFRPITPFVVVTLLAPYFCAQAAYLRPSAFLTLRPFARFLNLPL